MHWITSLADVLGDEWQVTVAKDLTLQSEQILEVAAKELETLPQPLRAVIIFRRKSKA
jgi:16S rRNA C1402 (ribose-2'-O) methylase RsmI